MCGIICNSDAMSLISRKFPLHMTIDSFVFFGSAMIVFDFIFHLGRGP